MLPLIYTNLDAALLFIVACLVWNIPEAIGMFRQRAKRSREEAEVADQGSLVTLIGLLWVGLALNFILSAWIPEAAITWHRLALFLVGVVLILVGVVLRWYSIWTLGRYFTRDVAVSADQTLVRHGPYGWIRHPAYTGTFLTMLGVGLAVTNWASLAALLTCVAIGHVYRIHVEEMALTRILGQPYVEYSRNTRRFIPWVL